MFSVTYAYPLDARGDDRVEKIVRGENIQHSEFSSVWRVRNLQLQPQGAHPPWQTTPLIGTTETKQTPKTQDTKLPDAPSAEIDRNRKNAMPLQSPLWYWYFMVVQPAGSSISGLEKGNKDKDKDIESRSSKKSKVNKTSFGEYIRIAIEKSRASWRALGQGECRSRSRSRSRTEEEEEEEGENGGEEGYESHLQE